MISVIIPVYNVEKYLSECIDSVLRQTYKDIELILVDDGATDSSGDICDDYANKDSRITVIHQENRGLSGARNAGTARARGELLLYLDSDDLIHPRYLELLYKNLIHSGADVSVCRLKKFFSSEELGADWLSGDGPMSDPEYQDPTGRSVISGREACRLIVGEHRAYMIMAQCKLFRRSLAEHLVFPVGKLHEDEFVTYRVLYSAEKVVCCDAEYYGYRQRPGSIINSKYNEKRLDRLDALLGASEWLAEKGDEQLAGLAAVRYILSIQIAWLMVKRSGGDKALLEKLKTRHNNYYNSEKESFVRYMTGFDRMILRVFLVSPSLYGILATGYTSLFGTE